MKIKLYWFYRGSLLFSFLFIFQSLLFSQQVAKLIPNSVSPDGHIGFLEFRPTDYGSQKHPLIIFLHGIGERGNGTTQVNSVAANAIPKYCKKGATMRFTVGGVTSSFVVLSPQLSTQYGYWPTFYVKEMIKYARANLQIDTNRIYITGLSLGGGGVWRAVTEAINFDYSFDAGIAAAAPCCGTQEEADANVCRTIADNHLPVWAFHCMDDGTVGVGATQHAEMVLSRCAGMAPAAKFTYYQSGGHAGAWNNAFDTGHITRIVSGGGSFTANPNLYEWFLSHTRSTGNTAPVANAGNAQIITLPLNTIILTGSGTGTNGATISSYSWTKTSGPVGGIIGLPLSGATPVTALVQGTYVFTLTVKDNHGLTNSASVTITVNPLVNQLPVANAGSNTTITLPANSVTLNGTASNDPDGTISSYAWSKISGPAAFNIANAAGATTMVTNLVQGIYVFTLQVKDNSGATASSTVTVTVNAAPNQVPIANAGSNTTITLPTNNTTLNGSASSDPDGTIRTYSWIKTSGPATYSIANAGAATTALTNLVQGIYVFSLQVKDNGGATASSTVTITVNAAANQPPVANAGSNTTITLPTNNTTLNGSASSDADGTISIYAWTKTSGPSSYNIANSDAATAILTSLVQGAYVFTLQVTDNAGATSTSTVTVTVNAAANQPPVANAGSNAAITLPINNTTLNGSASSDSDGTISTYAWTKISGPASYNIANPATATTALTNLVQGAYVFTLQVTDNAGATDLSTITVTVNAVPNQSPVANAGSNITIRLPTNNTTLNGGASSDPDGTISSYAWTKTSGPAAFNITSSGAATTALTNLVEGVYVFTLQVTDNGGAKDSSTVMITVNAAPNQVPVANAGSNVAITLPVNNTTLNGTASSDPDGTISTYAWTKTSGPAAYTIANANAATTALTSLAEGVYVFTLQVTDNSGASAYSVVTVTVNAAPLPANQSPVADAGTNITITLPTNNTTLNGSASSDPDGTINTYAWTKTSGPALYSISAAGAATTTLTNLVPGVYVFALQVTDNSGATASSTVTVKVNASPNQAPVADAGSNITISLPKNNTTLNGTASADRDGTINTYLWTKVSGPGPYTIANAGAATSALSNLVRGVYVFMLQVTDNGGATDSSTVTITVNAAPNQSPVADAGSNITITLPKNNTTLNGTASGDPDGTISAYAWKRVSGPGSYSITNPAAITTGLTNLVQGVYIFSLQVTDNAGAIDSSTVTVTVNAAPNQAPAADAGSNITITLPINNTKLNGSASTDPDGTIKTYTWTKISGPASYSIANAAAAATALTNLVQGVYVFTLQVTDNAGATGSSTVSVTVNAAPIPANQPPVANAGNNINIVLPNNSVTLDGTASSDPDGTISSYVWRKISGPASYNMANAGAAITTISSLSEGVYVFTLQVTDNAGAVALSSVAVTVDPAPNQAPLANAGADISVTLPVNTADLNGSASSDADGTIINYSWNKLSGPGATTIVNSNTATPDVIGLVEGQYVFELTVTDNNGAVTADQVMVTVYAAPNQAPVANAGKDTSILLPLSSIVLSGSHSLDTDGTIGRYQWKEISGPSAAVISQADSMLTIASGLLEGDYIFELQVTDNAGITNTAKVKVSVLNGFRYSQFYKLYPNPATSTINLQFIDDKTGKLGITAYDVSGRMVISEEFSKDQSLITKEINISKLKPGVYYLEIRQMDGTKLIRPFVKQ